jgi:hypothetical protein
VGGVNMNIDDGIKLIQKKRKKDANFVTIIMTLTNMIMFLFYAATGNKEMWNWKIFLLTILIIVLVWCSYLITTHKIKHGLYGNNEEEAREVIQENQDNK